MEELAKTKNLPKKAHGTCAVAKITKSARLKT